MNDEAILQGLKLLLSAGAGNVEIKTGSVKVKMPASASATLCKHGLRSTLCDYGWVQLDNHATEWLFLEREEGKKE